MAVLLRAGIGGQAWVLGVLVMVLRSGLGAVPWWWLHRTSTKQMVHPLAGALELTGEASVEGT
jgi:hypothetical protein